MSSTDRPVLEETGERESLGSRIATIAALTIGGIAMLPVLGLMLLGVGYIAVIFFGPLGIAGTVGLVVLLVLGLWLTRRPRSELRIDHDATARRVQAERDRARAELIARKGR